MSAKPSPAELWEQAHVENPGMDEGGKQACRVRYRELMLEHGHLIPATDSDVCGCGHARGSHIRPFGCQRCKCYGFTLCAAVVGDAAVAALGVDPQA